MDLAEQEEHTTTHEELSHLSMQEIQELRNKMGIKQFNKAYGTRKGAIGSTMRKKKRVKNTGPMEVSSKRHLDSLHPAFKSRKAVTRDPRFDDLSGNYDDQLFKRSYKFVDRMKAKEQKAIRKIAEDEEMDDESRKRAKDMLTRMSQRKAAKKETTAESRVERTLKEERKKALKEGHKPYFLKASEKKKLVLAEQYKELKKKGQLDKFMNKKRKQNAKKGEGSIPGRTER